VGGVQPTAMVDLGRPAFKLGIAEIRVGWRGHALQVGVAPERSVYHVREKARVRVTVQRADAKPLPAGSEIALAAVDEGLLELAPNESWKSGGLRRRLRLPHRADQVVGKPLGEGLPREEGEGNPRAPRHAPLWKGRSAGRARRRASVPLNSLGLSIVAIATSGVDLFGTGAASIRTTQDLLILPGLAPVVREGDRFRAEFTVRNATDRSMDVTLAGRAQGLAEPLAPRTARIAPGDASVLGWDITAPAGITEIAYEVEAAEPGGARDRLRTSQRVVPAVPVRTTQATLSQLEGSAVQPIERPATALPDAAASSARSSLARSGRAKWMKYPLVASTEGFDRRLLLDEKRWNDPR
jgi:uncharacterized protein YfaS (alpha-2-macroglobulin family)